MINWTEIIRVTIAALAFFVGGCQLTIRYMISHRLEFAPARVRMERTLGVAAVLLLAGVGVGNLQHRYQPITIATVLVSLGVVAAGLALTDIWAYIAEENADMTVAHTAERKGRVKK